MIALLKEVPKTYFCSSYRRTGTLSIRQWKSTGHTAQKLRVCVKSYGHAWLHANA